MMVTYNLNQYKEHLYEIYKDNRSDDAYIDYAEDIEIAYEYMKELGITEQSLRITMKKDGSKIFHNERGF